MKTIGLIGGISWESSAKYYELINRGIQKHLGGVHSGKVLLYSFDFAEIAKLQHEDKWTELGTMMADAARSLERGGADFIVICANTMHKLVPEIEAAVTLPILHVVDATAAEIQKFSFKTVGLLGTRFTMEGEFLKQRLAHRFGIASIIPDEPDRVTIHRIIFDELVKGNFKDESRQEMLRIMNTLSSRGAQGIILGCTEFGLLVNSTHTSLPLFDTAALHAEAAIQMALEPVK